MCRVRCCLVRIVHANNFLDYMNTLGLPQATRRGDTSNASHSGPRLFVAPPVAVQAKYVKPLYGSLANKRYSQISKIRIALAKKFLNYMTILKTLNEQTLFITHLSL
jgi:hypothetical protein